jgi:hypothetical protein
VKLLKIEGDITLAINPPVNLMRALPLPTERNTPFLKIAANIETYVEHLHIAPPVVMSSTTPSYHNPF